jgi:peptidoglycan/xylan/chitin deacetylase (PgdA/CDA1 family)
MTERDFVGYGRNIPKAPWPNGARIAINFAVNYEEGAERSVPDGDAVAERGEMAYPVDGHRDFANETNFEYGSRVGVWRLLDIFAKHDIKTTFLACGRALERNPELGKELAARGHEPCSHGYRWGEHFRMTEDEEREEIKLAIAAIEKTTGQRPLGWYCRYSSSPRTRQLLAEEGGFVYDSDAYNDDLPYFVPVGGKRWLVVPYSMDSNDGRYWSVPGVYSPDDFLDYLKLTFERMYEEGATHPRMMSVGLHCRISGRPAKATAIDRFIQFAKGHPGVWFARRIDIARVWLENFG